MSTAVSCVTARVSRSFSACVLTGRQGARRHLQTRREDETKQETLTLTTRQVVTTSMFYCHFDYVRIETKQRYTKTTVQHKNKNRTHQ